MDAATRPLVSLPDELWMPVTDYEGAYLISDLGLPHSVDRTIRRSDGRPMRIKGQPLTTRSHATNGFYPMVTLSLNGVARQHYIHRLVLEAFKGPCPAGMEVRHLNGDPYDARLVNLEYGTHRENIADIKRHRRNFNLNLTHCPYGHPLEAPNLMPSRLPHRICVACSRARSEARANALRGVLNTHQAVSDRKYDELLSGVIRRRAKGSMVCRYGHPLVPLNLVPSTHGLGCLACRRTYGVVQRAKARGESPDFQAISDRKFAELAGLVPA